jgi:ribosomal protein L7/L12
MSGLSAEQERQIRDLMARDQKISAIKIYREATGASLSDAKEAVETMQRGVTVNIPAPVPTGDLDPFLENRIKRLLAERKKIEAVKAYREAYNCGLKDAKDAVDMIQADMRREEYSNPPSLPAINNDPFAEDTQRNRRFLLLGVALVVILIGGLAFLMLAGNGF